jgi:ketosteroid isomerase-like protein
MSEVEEFLTAIRPRLTEAEVNLHNGDATQRIAMWSRNDPVTLFGAATSARGWSEIGPVFDWLATTFANCTSYENEIVAAGASGDLAYIVAVEHTTASINGAEARPYKLRATTIFRREDGEWRVVHRHGDPLTNETAGTLMNRLGAVRS